jgi:hypothetical protein
MNSAQRDRILAAVEDLDSAIKRQKSVVKTRAIELSNAQRVLAALETERWELDEGLDD